MSTRNDFKHNTVCDILTVQSERTIIKWICEQTSTVWNISNRIECLYIAINGQDNRVTEAISNVVVLINRGMIYALKLFQNYTEHMVVGGWIYMFYSAFIIRSVFRLIYVYTIVINGNRKHCVLIIWIVHQYFWFVNITLISLRLTEPYKKNKFIYIHIICTFSYDKTALNDVNVSDGKQNHNSAIRD